MRVVVTGAAGLTGGAVTREMVTRGHDVVGIIRRPDAAAVVHAAGAEPLIADCAIPGALEPALRRAECLVHVAGILFGEAIATVGLDHLRRAIAVSTAGVYSRSRSSVDAYRRNEAALIAAHAEVLLVRPTMIYGSTRDRNVHRVIAFARRWRFLPLPSGGQALLQPIHYADLASAVATLADGAASGIVDAGGPRPITVREAGLAIFAALGSRPRFVPVPLGLAIRGAAALDQLSAGRWRERLMRLREDRTVDDGRLLELTGVRLRSFAEGVREQVAESPSRS